MQDEDVLSPYLFNLFIENPMQILKLKYPGMKVNGNAVYCIRFSNSTALLADKERDMEKS